MDISKLDKKNLHFCSSINPIMRKADIITTISEKTGVPKVDVLVAMEAFLKK